MRSSIFAIALLLFLPLALQAGEKEEALWNAAREGDVATVKKLLAEGVDVNARNRYEATALFFACDKGHTEVVRTLIEAGADVNAKDNFYGATPLTWAVSNSRLGALRLLLENGAEGAGDALPGALRGGDLEMLEILLELGKPGAEALSIALSQAQAQQVAAAKDGGGEEEAEAAQTAARAIAMLKEAGAQPPPEANFTVPAETLARYAGRYSNEQFAEIVLSVAEGALHVTFPGGSPTALGALDLTTFRLADNPAIKFVIQAEEGAVPTAVTFQRGAQDIVFTRAAD